MSAKTTGGTDRPTPPRTVAPPPTETPRFTPGPWFVEDIDGSGDLSICYDERPRNPAAGFPSMLGFCFNDDEIGGGIRYDEARANARMMAAAPVMYAALRECAKHLRACGQPAHARIAEIALAEATGEARPNG